MAESPVAAAAHHSDHVHAHAPTPQLSDARRIELAVADPGGHHERSAGQLGTVVEVQDEVRVAALKAHNLARGEHLRAEAARTDEQREFADTIRDSGETLLAIINDILDLPKIEANRLELEHEAFDLRACVESALDAVAPRAAEKGIELTHRIEPGVPEGVVGDVTRLRQVLVNLLSNVTKFTEVGARHRVGR